ADDDPDILKVVAANLRAEGMEVEAVSNGLEALARALRTSPDLIILDIAMPGRNGLEVMAALRQHPETKDIPVVFLTARSSDADDERRRQDALLGRQLEVLVVRVAGGQDFALGAAPMDVKLRRADASDKVLARHRGG